jgi:hypothetical protein
MGYTRRLFPSSRCTHHENLQHMSWVGFISNFQILLSYLNSNLEKLTSESCGFFNGMPIRYSHLDCSYSQRLTFLSETDVVPLGPFASS